MDYIWSIESPNIDLQKYRGDFEEHPKAILEIDKLEEVVDAHFRPEFINRIDETVVFHPLDQAEIRQIADIQLNNLRKRLAARDLGIQISDEALDLLAEAGFDPVYGARSLKRAIQQQVENSLAQQILSSKFMPGDTIAVGVEEGRLAFTALVEGATM